MDESAAVNCKQQEGEDKSYEYGKALKGTGYGSPLVTMEHKRGREKVQISTGRVESSSREKNSL